MKYFTIVFLFVFNFSLGNSFWGKNGHRVVGEVAYKHLSGRAKRQIDKILQGEGLAFVSTYADEIKSDRDYKEYSPWHYVNFPFDKKYGEEAPSEYGDLIKGIEKCISVLKNAEASRKEKAFYLKLLIHFVGDLHQPLHVGRSEDKGGNDIQVQWFGSGSNLHRVWDTNMIEEYNMSYKELAENLPSINRKEKKKIQAGSLLDWVYESQDLAKEVYSSANTGEKLGYKYMYDHFEAVRVQLQKGGLRLAKLLNEIF